MNYGRLMLLYPELKLKSKSAGHQSIGEIGHEAVDMKR